MRSLSNFENSSWSPRKCEFSDLADLAQYPKRFKTRGTCVQRPKTGTICPFGTIQSSLSLSTALELSQDALHYSQKLNWDAQWLFENFVSQWIFFIRIIRSSSLGPSAPLYTQKSCFEQFKVVCPYLLLLGNPKMSQTTLRYTNWMHSDYAKSLIQNENSAAMLFKVRHLVLAAPCTLQKDCLIRVPNKLLLSTALGLLLDNSNYYQIP